jgi:pyruvate dehydrogenase E1 component alpha subunit
MDRHEWLTDHGVAALRRMLLIREIESRLPTYLKEGLISGSTHPSVGMEAVCVGVSMALKAGDSVGSTHRGHGHCLAKGAEPAKILAELFGRADGYCGGKGGSMHIASRELGILGTNGIVGASIGIATGAALAAQVQGTSDVAIAFFGDGAINQGMFHEALNLASIWSLPVVYVCENNQYAQSAAIADMVAIEDLSTRSSSYGIPGDAVDGMDVFAVWNAARSAVEHARTGKGPSLIVADTWRFLGHMVGDTERYRTVEDHDRWRQRDPIDSLRSELASRIAGDFDALQASVTAAVDDAEYIARNSPSPEMSSAFTDVYGSAND